ncbi:MAG TPA: zf-TFIIB domain-containing protein [Vicinamibacteria bacterium]|nr:zf-TFIIB domain-containing protein [Vicinamibacteria bacterium]
MDEKKHPEGFKPISQNKQEEDYFYKKDQELTRSLRKRADAERQQMEREQQKNLHWMRCPKCGGQMEEIAVAVLRLDRCQSCNGVFFDDGEIEILRQTQTKQDLLSSLLGLLGNPGQPRNTP